MNDEVMRGLIESARYNRWTWNVVCSIGFFLAAAWTLRHQAYALWIRLISRNWRVTHGKFMSAAQSSPSSTVQTLNYSTPIETMVTRPRAYEEEPSAEVEVWFWYAVDGKEYAGKVTEQYVFQDQVARLVEVAGAAPFFVRYNPQRPEQHHLVASVNDLRVAFPRSAGRDFLLVVVYVAFAAGMWFSG
jgi:hypothetical protein